MRLNYKDKWEAIAESNTKNTTDVHDVDYQVTSVFLPARIARDIKPEYRDYNYYINYCRMLDITPLPYTTKKDVKLNFGEWCDENNKWLKHFKMLLILNK